METRWNSLKETLEYFTLYWSEISVIVNATLKSRDQVYRHMEVVSIKRAATDQLAILDPVSEALNKVHSDKCLLDVCEIWRHLKNAIPDEYQAEVSKWHSSKKTMKKLGWSWQNTSQITLLIWNQLLETSLYQHFQVRGGRQEFDSASILDWLT